MKSPSQLNIRTLASSGLSLFFFIILISYLVFIEFFQDSQNKTKLPGLLTAPINKSFLTNVTSIKFKNALGQYQIKKDKNDWRISEPRVIPAKSATIQRILESLKELNISSIYQLDPINYKSFSLDNPLVEMTLNTGIQSLEVRMGLINPIDNTTYLSISDSEYIYQVNMFKLRMEKLEFSDFIDANIFSIKLDQIKKISLYVNNNRDASNVLERVGTNWISKRYRSISNKNTEKKIQSILSTKTYMIIDKLDDELKNFIDNYLSSPRYRITLKTLGGETVTYKISNLTKEIQELKVDKRQYFLVSASDRPHPFLVSKGMMDNFLIRYSDLKP